MRKQNLLLAVTLPLSALLLVLLLGDVFAVRVEGPLELKKADLLRARTTPIAPGVPTPIRAVAADRAATAMPNIGVSTDQTDAGTTEFPLAVRVHYDWSYAPAIGYSVAVVAEFAGGVREAYRMTGTTGPRGNASFNIPAEARTLVVDVVFSPSRQRVARRVERDLDVEGMSMEFVVPEPYSVSVQLKYAPGVDPVDPGGIFVAWDGLQGSGLPAQGLGAGHPTADLLASQVVHEYAELEEFRVTVGIADQVVATATYPKEFVTSRRPPELLLDYNTLHVSVSDATGAPIRSARVFAASPAQHGRRAQRSDSETDGSGQAELFVGSDSALVCVGKSGYQGYAEEVRISSEPLDVVLMELDEEEIMTVDVRSARGEAVAGAVVTATPYATIPTVAMASYVQSYTDEAGRARLPVVYSGDCWVMAAHRNHGSSSRGVIEGRDGAHVVIELEEVFELDLDLFVDGARWERNGEALYWHVEDVDYERSWTGSFMAGRTTLEELPTGRLMVHLLAPGRGLFCSQTFTVDAPGLFEADALLEDCTKVRALLPAEFHGLAPTSVALRQGGDSGLVAPWFRSTVADDGSIALFLPAHGDVELSIRRDGAEIGSCLASELRFPSK